MQQGLFDTSGDGLGWFNYCYDWSYENFYDGTLRSGCAGTDNNTWSIWNS